MQQKGIDPGLYYDPAEVERAGLWKRDTLTQYRHRTRRTGRQVGRAGSSLAGASCIPARHYSKR